MKVRIPRFKPAPQSQFWRSVETLLALLALLNFGLVLFDWSYIRCRDEYHRYLPLITNLYDPVKGIQPHQDTAVYGQLVDELRKNGPPARNSRSAQILAELRDRSVAMIQENPFQIANKSGNLEKIKNRMRKHMGVESSREAFRQFWSPQYLNAQTWNQEMQFFRASIQPLLAENYYRPIDESGRLMNLFWRIDIWFTGIFAIDLLLRVLWIQQRHRIGYPDALLWRWYDLFLLLPFWRFLRIIPVMLRLHQVKIINLKHVQDQVSRNLAENIAGDITELVLIQALSIVQGGVRQGALRQWLKTPVALIDTNEVDEIRVIGQHILTVISQSVLPNIQPEMEALLHYYLRQSMAQAPLYSTIQPILGLEHLVNNVAQQVSQALLQQLATTLDQGKDDASGQHLVAQLGQQALNHFATGLTQQHTIEEIEGLLADWLEELKLTVLQRLEAQSQQQIMMAAEAVRQLRVKPSSITVLPK
jgi:hypothetical protein